LSQRSYHYTILWVSYMFIHSCIYNMLTNIIHAWLHCQSYFNCTKSVIHDVSKSEMLPIMYISSGRSDQNSRLPTPFSLPQCFPQCGRYPIEVIDGTSFSVCWSLPHWGDWRYLLSYVDGISFRMLVIIPVKIIDGIFFRMLTVFSFVCWSLSQ